MQTSFVELDTRGLSGQVWKGFSPPEGGIISGTTSGNPAIGMFDDFMNFSGTSLYDGYFTLGTGSGTVLRTATNYDTSTAAQKLATGMGIVNLLATADDDEAIMAWGNGLDAPFKMASGYGDLAFECRILSDILLANDWAFFVGLAELGAQATVKLFDTDQDPAGTHDQLGFIKLMASSTSVDTYCNTQGGASDKGTTGIHTNVASQYVKLGFRFESTSGLVRFYVNGVEKDSYRLDISALTAGTFPDDEFMTPMIAVVTDQATDMTAKLDWWACAQML